VYIRPATTWNALSSEQLLKLATILHLSYSSADFCACLLKIYDRREGTDFFRPYTEACLQRGRAKEERIRLLEAELQEKEQVIRELDQAARERLELINRLTHDPLESE
jgi:hypothetical protein